MKSDIDKAIIANVKRMREKLEISQRRLAIIIGTTYGFVNKVENESSHQKYSAQHLYLIAEDFDCEVSDLFPPLKRKG